MDKAEFDQLFEYVVVQPLQDLRFKRLGQSLARFDQTNTIILMRLGGKMTLPGTLAHILCFRHSFLRDFDGNVPAKPPNNPHEYPFKFRPSLLQDRRSSDWRYEPRNLNYDYDRFEWENRSAADVTRWLRALSEFIATRFVPWTDGMVPRTAQAQIVRYGEKAWCDRRWDEDYERFLKASSPA